MTSSHARLIVLAVSSALISPLSAQYPGVQGTVERQIQTLEQKKTYASNLVSKADAQMKDADYESAFSLYKSAVDFLPRGGSAMDATRQSALDGFCAAAVKLAKQRVAQGRYADARTTVDVVLEERYNPNYGPALSLRSQLLDPQGFVDRGTLTPDHVTRIADVNNRLSDANGFFDSGRYDLAFKRCEQALNIDKYNIAARRLMEQINVARQQYAEAAYNDTRGDLLAKVSKAWELPVKKFTNETTSIIEQPEINVRSTQAITDKIDSIKIPRIDFTDSSIREALEFIKKRARDLDDSEQDVGKKGVNIVLKLPPDADASAYPITLALDDVPLRAALEYVSQAANLKIKIEPYAVVVVPQTENTDVLITKEYKVPPSFIQALPGASTGAVLEGVAAGSQSVVAARSRALEYLEAQGVTFPTGASANFIATTSRLIVKNTETNLELVDALVETSLTAPPTQIEIEAKFLEVSQNNLNELGFDWLLGQFSLAGGSGIYSGGGTEGFGRTINPAGYPLLNPGGTPVGATSSTSGPITAGNRSGSTAISVNAIDALLLGSPIGQGAGILSVAGVFTNPQFQVVLRALNQKKGVDLISAPKVTTQSARKATIEIVREFLYPTQFTAPEASASAGSQFTPSVPTAPSGWTMKPTGITLEVVPTLGPDNYTIELELAPRVIEFDGFINYGSPINATVQAQGIYSLVAPTSKTFEATANTINQPVFSVREVTTQVSVYDGQTVVMGGLMREDVQKVEDKVPLLGDIPLAGRLFRSSADQHTKRNLIMFVTAGLLDPAGQPVVQSEDEDVDVPEASPQAMLMDSIPGDVLSAPLP
ncbi:MAG: type II and III secretion system protein [Verrucomicrobia bacterium]|nr:type II and III secretion system protein [Verrucomicrobiota bacterium]